jgi:hypothetical protein
MYHLIRVVCSKWASKLFVGGPFDLLKQLVSLFDGCGQHVPHGGKALNENENQLEME